MTDMMKVPGTESSLQEEEAHGADIRVVYSPLDSIEIARNNPDKEVVLFAVGFETTSPAVAATVLGAKKKGLKNFSALSLHKLTPPAMKALLDSGEIEIDGFIAPGHVTAIIGAKAYGFLADDYKSPCVVAGFEPIDALLGIYMLVRQFEEGRCAIEIEYDRVVTWDGNLKAQSVISEVFTGHPGTADPGRGPASAAPRSRLRALPRAAALHDPRRRPVVGRRDPADAQVQEPAAHDVGVVA